MANTTLKVPTIHCEGCVNSIKRSLGRLQGIQTVQVDLGRKQVSVEYDAEKLDTKAIKERVEAAGYAVE